MSGKIQTLDGQLQEILRKAGEPSRPIIPPNAEAFLESLRHRYKSLHEECVRVRHSLLDKAQLCETEAIRLKQEFEDFENDVYERYHNQAKSRNFLIEIAKSIDLHGLPVTNGRANGDDIKYMVDDEGHPVAAPKG